MKKKRLIIAAVLTLVGLILNFVFTGQQFLAYTLYFAALVCLLFGIIGKTVKRVICVLLALGLAYFVVVEAFIIGSASGDSDADYDYIIVLGAAVLDDRPSLALIHRMEGAMKYLDANPGSTAILCGGQGNGESMTEADCMYGWLTAQGVAPDRLIKEDRSTTTMENLQNAFDIIESRGDTPDGSIAIVSSCYHLYRAKCMAKLLGAEAAGVSGSLGYPIYTLNCFIREAFGVTHLWVFGK